MNIRSFIYVFLILLTCRAGYAQEQPPAPLKLYINPGQGINFGAFTTGISGGTITVDHSGTRISTGDVILLGLGYPFSPAIYEVEANPGTVVSILNGGAVSLSGSNGGNVLLNVGNADVGTPFIVTTVPPSRMQVRIGGSLTIGNPLANPPGSYSGTYSVTFIQE